jgi:ferric-dicitrate binding protein FerR (iron transport regulator)
MERNQILKYLNGSASSTEEKEVEDWIGASQKNTKKYNLLKAQYIISTFDETAEITSVDSGFRRYKTNIDQSSKNKKRRKWDITLKYAAMIVLLFGLAYLADKGAFSTTPTLVIPEDAITLQLENGNIQVIKEDGATQVTDPKGTVLGTQQGNRLIYNNRTTTKKLTYNTLTVPYGKRFDLVLSDSTRILLNAGTSIKYPVKFIKGKDREIHLTGEAFFEVAKDAGHPFIVNANGLNIRVLGTKFNVSVIIHHSVQI